MSSKRTRRSSSGSRSPDPPMSKSKRTLDLVSTRRISPPSHYNQRYFRGGQGRGRSSRRPYGYRGSYGGPGYRRNPQRYYPRYQRYSSRDETHSRHRRSHSRGHSRGRARGHSREKSDSRDRDRHHRSRSSSSSSKSESQHRRQRSKSQDRHPAPSKDVTLSHLRSSSSPDQVPMKKKSRRQSSTSSDRPHSSKGRPERDTHQDSYDRRQHHSASKHDEDNPKFYVDRHASKGEEEENVYQGRKYGNRSPSKSPEIRRSKKASASSKGKELIPRNRLHKIFSLISQDADFELEEDISIAIQRNPYAEPSEDSTVTVVLDVDLFSMIYPNEGRKHKPIFDREEIKMFGHDKNLADDPDFERRVIRVKPGKSSGQADPGPSTSSSYQYSSSLEITRTVKRNQSRSPSRSRSRSRSAPRTKQRDPQFRLRVSADPRFEARYSELQRREESSSSQRANLDPNDLRHELSTSRRSSSDARSRIDRDRGHYDDRRQSSDRREDKQEHKKDKEELPDYSRRKDKYQYTPWLDQPELIPKDPKYFLHDDRESMDPRSRGRGRGNYFRGRSNFRRPFRPYRGRGNFRGPYRGRGNVVARPRSRSPRRSSYSAGDKSVEREWKHDKFSELEHEGDKKSHREDDQHPHSTSER